MLRYRATLAYDGTAYQGFQRQVENTPTVQLAVEQSLQQVTQQQVTIIAAGRTDSGVHARGQVIAFEVEWKHGDAALLRAINAVLPDDIAIQDICPQADFHPRFDASSRVYQYSVAETEQRQPLLRTLTWQVRPTLDLTLMQQAADLLIGEHDFAAFGNPPQGTNTIRQVFRSIWTVQPQSYGRLFMYEIEATAFLHHMVRRVVGQLVEVGRKRRTVAEFEQRFHSRDLAQMRKIAPPQGLVLERVHYNRG